MPHISLPIIATDQSPFLVYCSFEDGNNELINLIKESKLKDFTLMIISGFNWDEDLTPYPASPIYKGEHYLGKAQETYKWIEDEITKAVKTLNKEPSLYGIIGYSISGLFAFTSSYFSSKFSLIASCSGSLWYPDLLTWINSKKTLIAPKKVYLSLGDTEKETRNPVLSSVEERTLQIKAYLEQKSIPCFFEFNPGNHFKDVPLRVFKGIKNLIED